MSRRKIADAVNLIPGDYALAVGEAEMPTPRRWQWHKLTDLARLESGHTPSRSHPEYWDGKIPWIGIPDARLNHGRRISTTSQTVTQAGIDNSAARLLPKDTVCLSRTASVGYVTVMDRPMATSQDFVNWICGPEIDPEYLMHLLLAEKDALLRFGKGSTHTTIYFPEVQAFRVCAPPRAEQRRIVAKLDALRARSRRAKDALDAVPALLDRLRQSILAAAFRGDLTADWREQNPDVEPASELLKRIRIERRKRWEEAELAKLTAKGKAPKDDRWKSKYVEPEPVDESELPELPDGWCWAAVEEVVDRVTDGTHLPPKWAESGVPFLVISDVTRGEIDWSHISKWITPAEHARITAHARPARGDVLYTAVGSYGIPIVVRVDHDFAFQRHIAHLVRPQLDPDFLALALRSPTARVFADRVARGNAQKTVTLGDLRRLPVALPPLAEGGVLRGRLAAALGAVKALTERSASVRIEMPALDTTVLAAAFRGELFDRQSDPESVV